MLAAFTLPSAVPAATSPPLRDREDSWGSNSLSYTCLLVPYPKRLFENRILIHPVCRSGKGKPVAVRCLALGRLFSLPAPKLNIALLRA